MTPRALEVDESYETYRQRMQSSGNPKNVGKTKPGNLSMQAKMWPTPVADGDRAVNYKQGGTSLGYAARMWPTPRSSEHKDCGPVGSKSHTHMLDRKYLCAATKESDRPTGKLNPQWVEWLMGYPVGWTDLGD